MSNQDKYNKVFMNIFKVGVGVLDDGFANDKIAQWDSVAHLSLITAIEDEFDIMFDAEDILDFHSYKKGKTILNKYGVIL